MQLKVRELRQTACPGYVVMYVAEFDTGQTPNDSTAYVVNTIPSDADPLLADLARQWIAEAFTSVLKPLGLSTTVAIGDLVIHDVDFSEYAFKKFTMLRLRELMGI